MSSVSTASVVHVDGTCGCGSGFKLSLSEEEW